MNRKIRKWFFRSSRSTEIDPDQIFLDSSNLPHFDTQQFEGRLDTPISKMVIMFFGLISTLVMVVFVARAFNLQVVRGEQFRDRSEKNNLRSTPLFAARGMVSDRNNEMLAWNIPGETDSVAFRKYKDAPGLAHVVGYVQYPSKDSRGFYYREDFVGIDGAEKFFNSALQGKNGSRIIEVNALNKVVSQSVVEPPKEGASIVLSIDSRVQSALYREIKNIADSIGFVGGAGVIMDVQNGEIIAMTSYPEYSSEIMSKGSDGDAVRKYLNDLRKPFLDRVIDGLYAPGSTVKPYLALAALNEKIIDPLKIIMSNGSISVPNEYNPTEQSVFRDWKVHGPTDMRKAIAVSSDVYFYTVSGGYKDQKGLGIAKIDEYISRFGFGEIVDTPFFKGSKGVIPTPEWKKKNFSGETWRLGDTYHTSIGQYGFLVSPLQMVRATAAIASNGILRNPTIVKGEQGVVLRDVAIPKEYFKVVQEGMRQTVTDGTALSLNVPFTKFAAKTGTAELGVSKENVNSWLIGYWPFEKPRYAFAVVLEKGSRTVTTGASGVTRPFFEWMYEHTPEYFVDQK